MNFNDLDFKLELLKTIKYQKPSKYEIRFCFESFKDENYKLTDEEYKKKEKQERLSYLKTAIKYLKETKKYFNNILIK